MNALKVAAGLLLCASPLCAPALAAGEPAGDDTIRELSGSADRELSKSIDELNQLREQIANEKLPLAQELTALEDKLTQLRREHDRVTRLVDESNLGITTIRTEIKLRQDELSYVGNFLDEYARAFESKVNVSELQYCGEAIASAKQAGEDATLPLEEKSTRQLDFVSMSLRRLFDAVGGMTFAGVGVDGQGSVLDGKFALIGPVALFCAPSGGSGLVIAQTNSTKPLIRPLEGAMQLAIAPLIETGDGVMPLDASRGGALKALVQKTNLIHIFEKGGPIMWPLLVASVLALGTVLERLLFLLVESFRRDSKALDRFFTAVGKGDVEGAIRIGHETKDFVVRALGYALSHREQSLEHALTFAQGQELKRFRRGIPILDTVITLAPLLGLLGTVTGMMGSFSLIGGDLSAPGAITGGIAEALIATAFGLGIAITSLLPFNFLNNKLDVAEHELDASAKQIELLVRALPEPTPAPHRAALAGA